MRAAGFLREHGRRYTQLIAALLYNFNLTGFATGKIYKGNLKGACVPGLNCYSCPGAAFACPLGSLQGAIQKTYYKFPVYMLGTLLLFGVLFGRFICGFLCPFGLIQELIGKLPFPELKKSRVTRALSYLKYVILAGFVVVIPLIKREPGFCKYICPAGTLEAGIPLVLMDERLRGSLGRLFSWKVLVLVLCVIMCSVCYRAFCRFICPLGAFYSFFNKVAFCNVTVDNEKCSGCGACVRSCKMDIAHVGDHECIQCGECTKVCPAGAIGMKSPGSLRQKSMRGAVK